MMALMSSGALKVSAKLYVECYTVFLFDIVQIKSEIKRISPLSVFKIFNSCSPKFAHPSFN